MILHKLVLPSSFVGGSTETSSCGRARHEGSPPEAGSSLGAYALKVCGFHARLHYQRKESSAMPRNDYGPPWSQEYVNLCFVAMID